MMIEDKVEAITFMIANNMWFVPVLAFVAGLLVSLTPCSLASLPVVISYVSGTKSVKKKKALSFSLTFAFGMAVVYTSLGVFASLLGELFHRLGIWWYILLGLIMVLMALQMLGVVEIIPEEFAHPRSKRKGYGGAFAAGMLGGLFASHCALPVLITLLAIAAEGTTVFRGALMLLLFAIGHSVIVVVAGISASILEKMAGEKKYEILIRAIRIFMGISILVFAAYLVYLGFTHHH
ncbi:cytochrome c biogenesis protein CcdA [Bacillota bacterium]